MSPAKLPKWLASSLRVLALRISLGPRVSWPKDGKPAYIGPGARVRVGKGAKLTIGPGLYLSENALVQVDPGARAVIGAHVFMNANARIVAAESVEVGEHVLVGPNACIYDHDHVFDGEGVHAQLITSPIKIGSRSWIGANSLVTRGCSVPPNTLVGGGSVVTRPLEEPGVYAGSPARQLKSYVSGEGAPGDGADKEDLEVELGDREAQIPRVRGGSPPAGQAEG